MYWLDTLLVALLALGAALGFYSGFLCQIARILTFAIALMATIAFNDPATRLCQEQFLQGADSRIAQATAYVLVFLLVYISLFLATRLAIAGMRAADLEAVDRLLGSVFGAAKMALLLGSCSLAVANLQHPTTHGWMAKSALVPHFVAGMERFLTVIPEEYKDNFRGTFVGVRDRLKSTEW